MSNSYSIFCQQGSYFFNLRLELGAVSAPGGREHDEPELGLRVDLLLEVGVSEFDHSFESEGESD